MQISVCKKFYQTKEFKILHNEWRNHLEASGFEDIEKPKGSLKEYDRRTQNFDDKEQLLSFYLAIDSYLNTNPSIPPKHKELLELYTSGMYLTYISLKVGITYRTCWNWLRKYKRLFLYKE